MKEISLNKQLLFAFMAIILLFSSCMSEQDCAELILENYIEKKEREFKHHEKKESLLFWQASISGSRTDFEKLADLAFDFREDFLSPDHAFQVDKFKMLDQRVFSEKKDLNFLTKMKESGMITDSILGRQLDIIYLKILSGEFNPNKYRKLVDTKMDVIHFIQNYLIDVDGEIYSDYELDSIQKNTQDGDFLHRIFDARRELIGTRYDQYLKLIRLRNEFAKDCGFENYFEFMLATYEIKKDQVDYIINELDTISNEDYFLAKKVMDKFSSKRFGIEKDDLMPWHYSKGVPTVFLQSLDKLFEDKDVVKITADFFDKSNLGIQDILDNSLINSPHIQSQINYFVMIEARTDMRIMSNVNDDLTGLKLMMYLCSQAAIFKNISEHIPYLLAYPNPIISEGVGAFFTNEIIHYEWLNKFVGLDSRNSEKLKRVCRHACQIDKLMFSRRMLLMSVFEQKMYENPDQDLGQLWWDLNEQYLGIKRPEKIYEWDWAVNDKFMLMAGTSQTDLFAELIAAQLGVKMIETMRAEDIDSLKISKNEFIGEFLKKNIFEYGNVLPWNTLIEKASGEKLTAKYYFESIVNI